MDEQLDRRTRSLIASHRAYYDARADDYADPSKPDRRAPGLMPAELCAELVDGFALRGDVLELACGTGFFTAPIARGARSVTAVDASPRMLAINEKRIADPKVTYVCADLFEWTPERTYDAVFFGFWLSHVPPSAFDEFWDRVRAWLTPGGRVAFADEDDRSGERGDALSMGGVPSARRTLSDGRQFEIVKVFWRPEKLESRLRELGWDISVRRAGETFLYGLGWPAPR